MIISSLSFLLILKQIFSFIACLKQIIKTVLPILSSSPKIIMRNRYCWSPLIISNCLMLIKSKWPIAPFS